jgi:hypothetical protein
VDEVMRRAGLTPNSYAPTPSPLPRRFPTKEELAEKRKKWEDPMEWPDDHFDAGLIALQSPNTRF